MKSTLLLCALVTIATAIPTNHHETLEEGLAYENLPATNLRERKSPLHDHHVADLATEPGTEDIQTTSTSGQKMSPMEGRSFGFKKPIIVKKKIGYHVYRDSDEEMAHADPHENCSKQVKVKLCDEEPGSPKSIGSCFVSQQLNENISEKEIENSIKTAKEAVENLQRGFHEMEHNSKLATTGDKILEDDIAVHQHIEAARKALDHVHRNFAHIDSTDLAVPKTEDIQLKSSDEERLAQWKEAIDNIQKNFEIARNIEDAFKADSEQTNSQAIHTDESSKLRGSEHMVDIDSHLKSNLNSLSNIEPSDVQTKQRENSDVDMFTAPTEQKELIVKLHSDSLKNEKITEESLGDHIPQTKTSDVTPLSDGAIASHKHENLGKVVQNQQSKAANDINMGHENEENNIHATTLKAEKNTLTGIEDLSPSTKSAHTENSDADQTTKHHEHDMSMAANHMFTQQSNVEMKHSVDDEVEKSANGGDLLTEKHPIGQSLNPKSVPEIAEHHKKEAHLEPTKLKHEFQGRMSPELTPMQGITKHVEPSPIKEKGFNNGQNINENLMRIYEEQNVEHKLNEMPLHSITDMRMTEDQKYHAFLMRLAAENQLRTQKTPLSLSEDISAPTKMGQHNHDMQPSMRLRQDHNNEHHLTENHEEDPSLQHWTQEMQQNQAAMHAAKTATEFHETMKMNQRPNLQNQISDDHTFQDFLMRLAEEKQQNENLNSHMHEMLSQNRFTNNLANAHDMSMPIMHDHLNIMKHAMGSDMDSSMQPSMHVNMREPIRKPTMEHKDMHWNHHHHAMARYGSGLPITSASSGAVGVFPNANTGGCGIPLMLSCSPNVVSGTLAKVQPHPGTITPPAYRSGDDLMFYMKRDAKDTDELPTLKIQKSSLPFTHKSELVFDKTQ